MSTSAAAIAAVKQLNHQFDLVSHRSATSLAMDPKTSLVLRDVGVAPESLPRLAAIPWHRVAAQTEEFGWLASVGVVDAALR